jgi:hypothetical protein
MQAGDQGHPAVAAAADALGLQGGHPAAVRFVQPAQEQVQVAVEEAVGMVAVSDTEGAVALMNVHGNSLLRRPDRAEVL